MTESTDPVFIETKEYGKFLEFCDACRQYRYIGLCYGPPGVGKTLSARRYTRRDVDYENSPASNRTLVRRITKFDTIFYTPTVTASPRTIDEGISTERNFFYKILYKRISAENDLTIEAARQKMEKLREADRKNMYEVARSEATKQAELAFRTTLERAAERMAKVPKPTPALVVIDEADRLKMPGLEQIRDIFDRWEVGVVLIGMPGIEKRLARYPQLYSRVGFVHEFRPLNETETRQLLRERKWWPPDVKLPTDGLDDDEAFAAVLRITGGNFRLLQRLLTQIARVMEINKLHRITRPVVEAARESLVIGTA